MRIMNDSRMRAAGNLLVEIRVRKPNRAVTAGGSLVCLLLSLFSMPSFAQVLMVTIEDIGQPYTVIDGHCFYSEAAGFSLKGDPIANAMNEAFKNVELQGTQLGANAFVGMDVDFANRTEKDEGRVVVCGTFVKFGAQ